MDEQTRFMAERMEAHRNAGYPAEVAGRMAQLDFEEAQLQQQREALLSTVAPAQTDPTEDRRKAAVNAARAALGLEVK